MCKKSLLMMLLLALLVPWAAKAQSVPYEVQIGEGESTTGYFPFYTLYNYSIAENLFLASELTEAGVLPGQVTSLSWYATNAPGYEQQGISIWMANVDDEELTTTSHVTTDMTLVYTGSVTPAVGWNEFMCEENTFTWDGTSNILVFCQRNNGDWNSTVNWQATTGLDFNAMSYRYQDSGAYDVTVPNTMYTSTTRPNIIIKGVGGGGGGPSCARPTGLAINYTGGTTAEVSWNSDATAWNIDVNGTVTAITTNPYTLTNLELGTAYTVKVQANCGGGDLSDWSSAKSFTTDLCLPENMCELRYELVDSYGDGWNGNAIKVVDAATNTVIANLTIASGSSASGTFSVCDGQAINFVWVSGSYPGETSYTFYDINNEEIFSGSAGSGLITDYTVNCTPATCPKPHDLTVSYTGGLEATISWTSDATAWNMRVNGVEVNGVITNPYTLTGLELATTYEVEVQANCGDNGTSEWAGPVSFTTDLCMPEDQCALTFVVTDSYGDSWNGNAIQVKDVVTGEIIATIANQNLDGTTGEETQTVALNVCDGRQLEFSWISGSYIGEVSYTVTDINGEVIVEGSGAGFETFTYTVNCTVTNCKRPTNLATSEVGPRSAVLSWTENGEATEWVVEITDVLGGQFTEWNASANPYTIVGLEPETDYSVRVRPICSDFDDKWSTAITFTTDVLCPAPSGLTATRVTATSATLNWEGFAETYNVSYAPVVHGEVLESIDFDDSSMGEWTNIDFDGDGYVWVLASASPGVYHNSSADVTGTGYNSSYDYIVSGSYSNYAGVALTPDNYLVSPQITLGGTISFWACAQDASYAAEHFGVAVSTTGNTDAADFTTIWETTMTAKGGNDRGGNTAMVVKGGAKTNPGTTRSGNRAQGEWYHYIIDLSEYSGQGYVAIRHFGCTDQFMLNVDDIVIEGPAPDVQWINLTGVSGNSVEIDGLEAVTEYMWKVQGNCGAEDGMSLWSSSTFITTDFCQTPFDLEATDITYNAATLTWAGSQDSYNLRYRTAEVDEEYYFYDFNAGYDAAHAAGWNWEGNIIYGFDDPIYNIPGDENFFLQMGWATTNETYIFSPELPEYESGSLLEFYYFGYSTANTFQVGYSTTTNDTLSFTWGEPIDAPLQTYTKFSEELPAGTKYVAFKATAAAQSSCIFIDNFRIYKVMAAAGEWVTVENVTEPYELTGLTPETEYEWQVQGINRECDGGLTEWSEVSTFTTEPTQVLHLTAGWNWFSTYVEDADSYELLQSLLTALGENGLYIESNDYEYLEYLDGEWLGDLMEITPDKMYLIQVGTDCTISLNGAVVNPAVVEVTINPGWNWVGYPCNVEMTLGEALANFEAEDEDEIESMEDYAMYLEGEWLGFETQETLKPGQGFLYNSMSSDVKTLIFATPSAKAKAAKPTVKPAVKPNAIPQGAAKTKAVQTIDIPLPAKK